MHLWTEYEGRTVAGAYTLGKLLRSEGRNGFFSTADKKGQQAIIRLTEAHYDEDQMIERWRQVAGIQQENLIGIERVGKTNFDGVALTFALMESNDANLGDVLRERPLTAQESLQVARAVSSALLALHRAGLVHEHIEPANVLAVGEVVKLRSDCVRECVADKEFNTPEGCAGLRQKDVHDFATLMLECLTLEKELQPGTNLPEPFYRILPGALDGSLALEQIDAVLNPPLPKPIPTPAATLPTAPGLPAIPAAAASSLPTAGPVVSPAARPLPSFENPAAAPVSQTPQPPIHFRPRNERVAATRDNATSTELPLKRWGIYAAGALVVLLLLWHFLGSKPRPAQTVATAPVADATPAAAAPAAATQPVPQPAASPAAAQGVAPGWYVIAYTYNRAQYAQAKVEALSRRHALLNPQVFNPTGHGPFYVALGGAMTQQDATTVLRRARRSGMPRDTFIRNF